VPARFLLLLSGLLAWGAGIADGALPAAPDSIWYGPMSLNPDHSDRSDFVPMITDAANWRESLPHVQVFKQFIEALIPGRGRYSDADLAKLAAFCRAQDLHQAFEIGAVRLSLQDHAPGEGKRQAAREIKTLRRWTAAGGTVDDLTSDHAVMKAMADILQGPHPPLAGLVEPSLDRFIAEAADSLQVFHQAFPAAKIGMIESLGFFSVRGIDGRLYRTTDPQYLPDISFEDFFDRMQAALAARGLRLDHFHIDYDLRACRHDGGGKTADFGRILAVEKYVRSRGVKVGILVNAWDPGARPETVVSDAKRASKIAVAKTLEYFDGYRAAGGHPDQWVFERWQNYPDRTGPETDPDTDLGLLRAMLRRLERG
jgi:hypothetical protein